MTTNIHNYKIPTSEIISSEIFLFNRSTVLQILFKNKKNKNGSPRGKPTLPEEGGKVFLSLYSLI